MPFTYSNLTLAKILSDTDGHTEAELQPLVDAKLLKLMKANPTYYRHTEASTAIVRRYAWGEFDHEDATEDPDNVVQFTDADGREWTQVYSDEYMAARQGQLFDLPPQRHTPRRVDANGYLY